MRLPTFTALYEDALALLLGGRIARPIPALDLDVVLRLVGEHLLLLYSVLLSQLLDHLGELENRMGKGQQS